MVAPRLFSRRLAERRAASSLCGFVFVFAQVFVFAVAAAVVFAVEVVFAVAVAAVFAVEVVLAVPLVFPVAGAALPLVSVSLLRRDVLVVKGCSARAKRIPFERSMTRLTAKSKNSFASVTRLLAGSAVAPKALEQLPAQPA